MTHLPLPASFVRFLLGLVFVFAAVRVATAAEPSPALTVPLGDADPLTFVWIPPGAYVRGSAEDETGRDRDEGPAHPVTLTRGYYLGRFEVTQGQWLAVMGNNPAAFTQGPDALRQPVESVSWHDVQAFIARLNARGIGTFRLPTEAEWEYAARAGTATRYSWGNDGSEGVVHRQAWANSRSAGTTHPVGTKPANPWGLHDMHGGVWEWCADWYGPYSAGPQTDPTGPATGTERVFRGGSWYDFAPALRSANRHRHVPDGRYTAVGLRLVYSPPDTPAAPPKPEHTVHGPVETVALPHGASMRFVRIPAGSFTMGSPETEAARARDEGPQRTVTLTRDFRLGQFEVTQAQWRAVMGENPSLFQRDPAADRLPVEQVTYPMVRVFLERLNGLGLGTFRLPTEAEWEYAARAGTTTRFPWCDDLMHRELPRHGWYHGGAEGRARPVGEKAPNAWGLYDVFGNVWEWCSDWFAPYDPAAVEDPKGPATGTARVIRGGSWFNEPEALRPANRHRHSEESRLTNLGLRLVWSGPPTASAMATPAADARRPRLFLGDWTPERLRALPDASPHHALVWRELLARLERGIDAYTGRPGYRRSALAREAAFAYRVTGDRRYAELAFTTLRTSRQVDEDQPDRNYSLSRAMMSVGYALAYDWCHDAWTESQRAEILAIMKVAADAWPDYRHGNLESPHRGSNWVGVSRGGELLLHLAARGDGDYGRRDERIVLCLDDLARHIDTAYGISGWSQEGLGYLEYTFGFLAPAAYAARDAGYPILWEKFQRIAWPRLAQMSRAFLPGQRMLQSGVSGPASTNEGFVSLVWPLVPPAERPAYRWFYDRHAGVLAQPAGADHRRAASIWALLYYPADITAAPPTPGALMDEGKGAYYFRNRWQDGDDILVSLITRNDHHSHGWSQNETWQIGLLAFGTAFAGGPVKERAPDLYSKVLINGAPERLGANSRSRELRREVFPDGGGLVVNDAAGNFGLARAERTFRVDFSGRRGAPAVIEILDTLENPEPFAATFQLRPEAGVTVTALPPSPDAPGGGFLLRRGDAWLRGWVRSPAGATIETGPTLKVNAPRGTRTVLDLTLALGQGGVPAGLAP